MELPARPVCAQMILSSPTTQLCPICTRLSILAPRFTRVSPNGCAIHRSQALDFHIVFDHGHAGLHDLVMRSIGAFGEAESVAADHHAVLQDHAIADAAKFAHRGVRMRQ
jgi:hypothetical protein